MTLRLRYMALDDIPQVINIDRFAFETPWSARSYAYEISESNYSHMVVLERSASPQKVRGLRRFWQQMRQVNGNEAGSKIVGYGGMWRILEEAHISTIATHPDWRGKGYGEVLLGGMIQRAIKLDAHYIVLEVRVSNEVAQHLYIKYDFKTVGVKKRYYRDNGEDAYDMRLELSHVSDFDTQFKRLCDRFDLQDQYTHIPQNQET